MADGLDAHEIAVGVKQNTEVILRGAIDAVRGAEADCGTTKTGKADAPAPPCALLIPTPAAFLKSARAVLAKVFGEDYSPAWEAAGFTGKSTAVPGPQEERLHLCAALKTHCTARASAGAPA